MLSDTFCELMEQNVRQLRAYARSLVRNTDGAHDLVQDTLVRAWTARDRFVEGTNFKAWLFTIMRHRFLDERRKIHQKMEDIDTVTDERLTTSAIQESSVHFDDVARAYWRLSPPHREMLMLVGANGLSYEEAAAFLHVAVGTVRSRLSRARDELRTAMEKTVRRAGVSLSREKGGPELLALLQAA